jgi:hypothetical protein
MNNMTRLPALLLALLPVWATAQADENTAPSVYFSINHPELEKWEAYFQEIFFDKGVPLEAMGEGTGYLPYIREKHLYGLRKDYRGDAGGLRRWDLFRQMRARTLNRNGPDPVADWHSVGPNKMEGQGGRIISHAFEPGNSQVIWAGSASGGLWLSENGGDSWQPMSDQIPSTGVGAVVVNPMNPNTLLIGTGEGYLPGSGSIRPGLGVFKSTDRGMNWQETGFDYQQSAGVSALKMVWSYADTNIVWLAATNGIWKSTDAGLNWSLKKGDGTNQQTAICDDLLQHPVNPDILFAAIEADGVWKSTNGGETWFKSSTGLPASDMDFISIDLCRDQPDVLYASIAAGPASNYASKGLYRSDNGGQFWAQVVNAPDPFCPPGAVFCQGWYDNVVAVSPTDPDLVWFGGSMLWRSTNGGQNWTQHDRYICPNCTEPPACLTYVDQHDFAFDPQDPQTLYVFNDGGVAKSTDGGACWVHKNEGLVTAQLYAIAAGRSDPGTIVGGTQDHGLQGIKLSENTNLAWDRWGFLDGTDVEVHGANPNTLYGGWIDGRYFRTLNGVHSISTQITNGIVLSENNGFNFAILRKHPQNQFTLLGATKQRLYKSTNGGSLWTPVASMSEPKMFEFDQNDPEFAYAASWNFNGNWGFWRSANGGDSWAQTNSAPGWRVTDIKSSPMQAGLVYVSRNSSLPGNAHIFKSANFGDTWAPVQGDLPDLPVNAIAVHHFAPGVVFAATDLGVFITIDDGQHWTEYNDNLPVSFALDLAFNPADTTLLVGTLGRGAWRTKAWMPDNSTAVDGIAAPGSFGFVSVSPNPATATVGVAYVLEKEASVRLEVLNTLGQNVSTLFSGKQQAGQYSVPWDGRMANGLGVQAGVYFLRLAVGDRVLTKRLVWQ